MKGHRKNTAPNISTRQPRIKGYSERIGNGGNTLLTERQKECYEVMREYKKRNGVIPSYAEIVDLMGLSNKSEVNRLVLGMEKRGAIQRIPHAARAIKLLPID